VESTVFENKYWFFYIKKINLIFVLDEIKILVDEKKHRPPNKHEMVSPLSHILYGEVRSVLDTTFCDKVYQWLATGLWFSPGTPVSSINKTDPHAITEMLNTIN
jgi:hypothetical protein